MNGRPTFGSLFAGIGGFDLALERAGWECKWQVEIDPSCQRVLARHWPDVPRHADIRAVRGADLEPVDLVCGGWPCQDVSVAGRRAGLAGGRSGLFFEFARVVAELAPRWVLAENVDGLVSSWSPTEAPPSDLRPGDRWEVDEEDDLGSVLRALGQLGYGWAYRVLDAQYFGLAQRRHRAFIVGCAGDGASAAQVLFEPESVRWHPAPSRAEGSRVAGAITRGSGGGCGPDDNDAQGGRLIELARPLLSRGTGQSWRTDLETETLVTAPITTDPSADQATEEGKLVVAHTLRGEGFDASEDGTGRGTPLIASVDLQNARLGGLVAGTLRHNRGQGVMSIAQNQRGEVALSDTAGSLSAGGGIPGQGYPAVHQGEGVRRLTPTECLRLQGFPDTWLELDPLADGTRYRMLGNSVPVPVVEWIGRRMHSMAKSADPCASCGGDLAELGVAIHNDRGRFCGDCERVAFRWPADLGLRERPR